MKFRNVTLERSDILGRRPRAAEHEIGKAEIEHWRRRLGYLSLFAGAATVVASQAAAVSAEETKGAVPSRISKKAEELLKKIRGGSCSKPELLRRQSEYRLPGQKAKFNMVELMAGGDNCPGSPIPSGTYTAAAPFTDSGTTVGANDTVTTARINTVGCIEGGYYTYSSVMGPDHIYSFTLTARGTTPRITVTPGNATYDTSIYILSNSGAACPAGTGNIATNCLVGTDVNFSSDPEVISPAKMNSLPLNVPLYLFIDSFYPGPMGGLTPSGPYTVTIQDVTIGGGPTPPANDAPLDFNGDGKSDYSIIRQAGGASGDLTWWTIFSSDVAAAAPPEQALAAPSDGFPTSTTVWGTGSDFPVPADYDGDGKDDFAVWRPGSPGVFYIVRSATATLFSEPFGQTGDDPSVVGDYTGDNRDDLAVYRSGPDIERPEHMVLSVDRVTPGIQMVPWGQGGDSPAPGDYDGDLKYDFVVQRPDSNGVNGRFWVREADGLQYSQWFGLAADSVVPGDYDDDGKTDFAVARDDNGVIRWDFEPSGTAGITTVTDTWGVTATDVIAQADHDGDGRTEYVVWRAGNPGVFYIMTPVTRRMWQQNWGLTGDYPTGNYNEH